MRNKPFPTSARRIILVNPTKYLGNLLLAGGLMQAFAVHCSNHGIALKIVLDESFRDLCAGSFVQESLVFFPRRAINKAGVLKKPVLYYQCLKSLRAFKADIAFNIEEDSATSHLTRLSGAAFTLGCSPDRHKRGYDHVIPLQFEQRKAARKHRWYSYFDVFATLGMPKPVPGYLQLSLGTMPAALQNKLQQQGWDDNKTTIAIHAGATKAYKQWPVTHVTELVQKLLEASLQPVLIGAGESDAAINAEISHQLGQSGDNANPVDLCNRLSLVELGQFLQRCALMIGNDSGPFHLGSALGVPGLVLWGPTNRDIWGPIGTQSDIVQGPFACDPACNKGHCLHEHRCLADISPAQVFANAMNKIGNPAR